MPDPTPVAMRLTDIAIKTIGPDPLSDGWRVARMRVARALDNAGVGEAEKAMQAVMDFWGSHKAWGDFASLTSAAGAFAPVVDKVRVALADLTGTQEVSDGE